MHPTTVKRRWLTWSVGVLLLCGSLVAGQPPGGGGSGPPAKKKKEAEPAAAAKSLEELLAAALLSNPDIRVAEAKLREAEAELNRARLQATQKVVTLFRGLEAQKALVQAVQEETRRLATLRPTGAVPAGSLEAAQQKVIQATAKLSEIEAEIAYLTGQQPKGVAADLRSESQAFQHLLHAYNVSLAQQQYWQAITSVERAAAVQGTMAERLRRALDAPRKVSYQNVPLQDVLKDLEKQAGITIRSQIDEDHSQAKVTLRFSEELPLGAVLLALADDRGLKFLVRPYGLLVYDARHKNDPPGAVLLHEFWKGEGERTKPAAGAKDAAPDGLEGEVRSVDAQTGYVTVNAGSDKGLAKGHALEAYRLEPTPKYLGTLQVVDARAAEAVCKPVGRPLDKLRPGDKVASRIRHK